MDLAENEIKDALLFRPYPEYGPFTYLGDLPGSLRLFEGLGREKPVRMVSVLCLHKDEKWLWESFLSLLGHGIQSAESRLGGFFELKVFSLSLREKIEHFDVSAFAGLLVRLSETMEAGQQRFLRFTSLYGIWKKNVPLDYGKVRLDHGLSFYHDAGSFAGRMRRRAEKDPRVSGAESFLGIADLSERGFWRDWDATDLGIWKDRVLRHKDGASFPWKGIGLSDAETSQRVPSPESGPCEN